MFVFEIQSYNWKDFKRNFTNLSIQVYNQESNKEEIWNVNPSSQTYKEVQNRSKEDDYSKEDDFSNAKLFAFDEKGVIKIHSAGGLSSTS